MTKKVIFRADGSSTTGLGHLYRLFSLVEIIKDTYEFVFVTREISSDDIIPESYNKAIIPETVKIEDEPQWLAVNYSPKDYIIIADGYKFIASYQKHIKEKGYNLVYIDDLANEHMYADVVVNHSPYLQGEHFKKESYTTLALGTKYALLRPLFLGQATQKRTIKTIDSAFVCFGGADPFNLSLEAVQALLEIFNFKKIHVVLGGAYKQKEIFNLEKKYSDKINTHKNLTEEELIEVMLKCNFAIAPASTILYELCCVKMPVLSGFFVDNQEYIYYGFLNNKSIYKGGNMKDYKTSDFVKRINAILKKNSFSKQIEAQSALFDDKIAIRLLTLINKLC